MGRITEPDRARRSIPVTRAAGVRYQNLGRFKSSSGTQGNVGQPGLLATVKVGDGRLIPLVIIDTSDRPDIEELVRVHEHFSHGDVIMQWGRLTNDKRKVALFLTFKRLQEVFLAIENELPKQGILVDQILAAKALYVQPSREGDRLPTTPEIQRLLIEVTDAGFAAVWDAVFRSSSESEFKRRGVPRVAATEAAT